MNGVFFSMIENYIVIGIISISIVNVPNLRFPGFEGEWGKLKVKEFTKVVAGATPATDRKEYWGGSIRWMNSGELNLKRVYEVQGRITQLGYDKTSTKIIPSHSVLIGLAGQGKTRGTAAMNYVELCTNQSIASILPSDLFYPEFLYQNIESRYKELRDISSGDGGRGGLNLQMIYNLYIPLCSIQEQKKIGEFLYLLDQRITIQNKVIEDCITLEKEIQNQVFGQISAPLVPLSSISQRVTEKNTALESDNVLTISAREGLVSQLEFFNKSVASENLSNYYLLRNGDFAYNKSYSNDYPWGAIKHLEKYDTGVLSPLYFCFRPNKEMVDTKYLQFFFDAKLWHKHIAEIAVEGARNHGLLNMSVGSFYSMPILLPKMHDQQTIAEKLSAFQRKRTVEESILNSLLTQKRFLLESLFI